MVVPSFHTHHHCGNPESIPLSTVALLAVFSWVSFFVVVGFGLVLFSPFLKLNARVMMLPSGLSDGNV